MIAKKDITMIVKMNGHLTEDALHFNEMREYYWKKPLCLDTLIQNNDVFYFRYRKMLWKSVK